MKKFTTDYQKKILEKLLPLDLLDPETKDYILNYVDFRRELTLESDRGCALLASSYLDHLLQAMLESRLIGSQKHLKSLFDFNGPLGSFSSKIKLAHSVGFISKRRMDDLNTIRKIRNEFGHSPSIISFKNEKIKSLCDNLKMITISSKGARAKFISSVSFVSGIFIAIQLDEEKFEMKDNTDIEKTQELTEQFMDKLKIELQKK